MMRLRVLAFLMLALAMLALPPARGGTAAAGQRALVLEIDGVIGPPLADYIGRELRAARPDEVGIIVLRMNTPGGLDTSMRQIVSAILASPVPVATYVAPNGARAASAGTYIAYASAIAAMAPGTNIGAATPIQLAGNPMAPPDPTRQKEKADNNGKSRRTGGRRDAQARQRRNRLYPQPRRPQRPQRRLGRRRRAFGGKRDRRRGALASRHRRHRRRRP